MAQGMQPHRGNDRAITPVIGGVIVVAVSIVLGTLAANTMLRFTQDQPGAQITGILGEVEKTLRTNLTDSDLLLMPVAGQPVLLRDAKFMMFRDGAYEEIPGTAIANQTADGVFWRAGEVVCIAGTSSGCLRQAADTVETTLIVSNQLMYRGTHHLRAFKINPAGGIYSSCSGPAFVKVVGSDITYGANGPQIPVRLNYTMNNGTTITPLFGLQPIVAGMEWSSDAPAGSIIGLRGSAKYSNFNQTYSSWISDPHVAVLKDGDAAPNVPAFGNQTAVEDFLQPFVDTATKTMRLSYNEVILLFEFNPNLNSPAADWQDAVALVRFPGGGCQG